MKLKRNFARTAGFTIVIVTVLVVSLGLFFVQRDINRLRLAGHENILWSAVRLEIELQRFQRTLAAFSSGNSEVAPDSVNDRFDILWSRISLFNQGTVGKRLQAYDENRQTVSRLFQTMHDVEADVVGLKASDRDAGLALQKYFEPFNTELRQLSRLVLHGEERKHAVGRENLAISSVILLIISAAAALASLLIIYVLARETHRYRLLAEENRELLTKSNRTNRAKSQFLAMMSHELRTPMNGVLGLLALVRQQGLGEQQIRLVDQAERSGQQMNSLLGDILDFTALQDDQLKLETKPFDAVDLADAVDDMFRPVAMREGITFQTRVDETCPPRLLGDFARLRQAIAHLATYVLETAGVKDIRLDIAHQDGNMTASISFDYSELGRDWNPVLMMGADSFSADSFASEALGPAVSRGLIEHMGGSTKLDNPSDNRIAILFSVPAAELELNEIVIRVISKSLALEAICKAAMHRGNVCVEGSASEREPNVVLIEAGSTHEAARVAHYGEMFPKAILVALGRPQNPGDFFDMIDVPLDAALIQQSKFMKLITGCKRLVEKRDARYKSDDGST